MSDVPPKAAHERLLPKAEEAGRQLVRSWIEYGPKQLNYFEPDAFPTGPLQGVAGGVLAALKIHGVKDMAGLLVYFADAPEGILAELHNCGEGMAPMPSDCGPLLEKLHSYHRAYRLELETRSLTTALASGDPTAEIVKRLADIEADTGRGKTSLRERAYSLRFNPDDVPPADETCMMIGDIPIASRGNLTVIQGKSKVGKSAVVAAILGAGQLGQHHNPGDTICINWHGDSTGAIVHLDTEQSRADWHALVSRSVTRSSLAEVSERLVSLPLVMFARSERLEILRQSLEHEQDAKGGIDAVVIDGIADLCSSPNDEAEALELVSRVMALSQEFNTPVFCILHENPGTDQGKTRGHLGSELNRKAFANLRIDKDNDTSVSTIYGTDMRKRDIPRDQGFCFGWDEEAQMHTFQGRSAGLKAAQAEEKAVTKCRAEWEPIYAFAAASGTKSNCPALTPNEAAEIERDISGTKDLTKEATMKKRMQRAESLGVLRKSDLLHWSLNNGGTSGT
ncbi:MAG: AAA family ATPase [Verrucomicrobiota bacterium]